MSLPIEVVISQITMTVLVFLLLMVMVLVESLRWKVIAGVAIVFVAVCLGAVSLFYLSPHIPEEKIQGVMWAPEGIFMLCVLVFLTAALGVIMALTESILGKIAVAVMMFLTTASLTMATPYFYLLPYIL